MHTIFYRNSTLLLNGCIRKFHETRTLNVRRRRVVKTSAVAALNKFLKWIISERKVAREKANARIKNWEQLNSSREERKKINKIKTRQYLVKMLHDTTRTSRNRKEEEKNWSQRLRTSFTKKEWKQHIDQYGCRSVDHWAHYTRRLYGLLMLLLLQILQRQYAIGDNIVAQKVERKEKKTNTTNNKRTVINHITMFFFSLHR